MPKIAVITAQPNHNLYTLLQAHQEKNLKDGEISLVVSRTEGALRLARKTGVETVLIPEDGEQGYDGALAGELAAHKLDLIVTLDSPHHFHANFINQFPRKIIAIHPALAGQFETADAVEQAFEAFHNRQIRWSGCNVHYVGPKGTVDDVMRQLVVPVEPKDTLERFAARMRKGEKWLLLKGVKQFLYELRIRNKRTTTSKRS